MTTRKTILVLGMRKAPEGAPDNVRREGMNQAELRANLTAQLDKAKDKGYELELKQFGEEDIGTTALRWTKEKLSSQHWDGVILGYGIRGTPDLTVFFEGAVNAAREITPKTRMGFNTKPQDLHETAIRMFDALKN